MLATGNRTHSLIIPILAIALSVVGRQTRRIRVHGAILLKNLSIRVDARGVESEFKAIHVTDAAQVKSVVEMFRAKYGAGDVKKYYSKFDVAVIAHMR